MTWTKLGDEFSDECANHGLTDAAYRTHVEAIGFVYRVEASDLRIGKKMIRRFAGSEDYEQAIKVLVALDWWRDHGGYYELIHHADVIRQSIAAQQAKRTAERERQRRKRARDRESAPPEGDVTPNVTPNTDRQTDKQLQASDLDEVSDQHLGADPVGDDLCPACQDDLDKQPCTWCGNGETQ